MSKVSEVHEVICYHCSRTIKVSGMTRSTSCPGCFKRVIIEDLVVPTYHAVINVETCGKLIVPKGGRVIVQKRVIALSGIEMEGKLQCQEAITARHVLIGAKAEWKGDLRAGSLDIKQGAKIDTGHFVVPALGAKRDADRQATVTPAPSVHPIVEKPAKTVLNKEKKIPVDSDKRRLTGGG